MQIKTIEKVLEEYPEEFYPESIRLWEERTGLSGVSLWRIECAAGTFALRRWPEKKPALDHLQYTQAVLWHAVYEGIDFVPLPLETKTHKGFVCRDACFWELLPWLGGENIRRDLPETSRKTDVTAGKTAKNAAENVMASDTVTADAFRKRMSFRIAAAMIGLAQFHEATSTFPLPNEPLDRSPAVTYLHRHRHRPAKPAHESPLDQWKAASPGTVMDSGEQELTWRRLELEAHLSSFHEILRRMLEEASVLAVPIQPSIGNLHLRHLLYDVEGLSGIIDFKEMGADSVALDIAALLGSIAGNDEELWKYGLRAYGSIRQLSEEEICLIKVFDLAGMIHSSFRYLEAAELGANDFTPKQWETILDEIAWLNHRLATCRYT